MQVWSKYDPETDDKLARPKAGEYLNLELAKVLEEGENERNRTMRNVKETERNLDLYRKTKGLARRTTKTLIYILKKFQRETPQRLSHAFLNAKIGWG